MITVEFFKILIKIVVVKSKAAHYILSRKSNSECLRFYFLLGFSNQKKIFLNRENLEFDICEAIWCAAPIISFLDQTPILKMKYIQNCV